jgi:hypothetical protein
MVTTNAREIQKVPSHDFKDGRISVNKSIHGESKSKSSVRVVPQLTEFKEFPRSPKTTFRFSSSFFNRF